MEYVRRAVFDIRGNFVPYDIKTAGICRGQISGMSRHML